jgi:hypothetical protein
MGKLLATRASYCREALAPGRGGGPAAQPGDPVAAGREAGDLRRGSRAPCRGGEIGKHLGMAQKWRSGIVHPLESRSGGASGERHSRGVAAVTAPV